MKTRRHHNNKGHRQTRTGNHLRGIRRLARSLRIPLRVKN